MASNSSEGGGGGGGSRTETPSMADLRTRLLPLRHCSSLRSEARPIEDWEEKVLVGRIYLVEEGQEEDGEEEEIKVGEWKRYVIEAIWVSGFWEQNNRRRKT